MTEDDFVARLRREGATRYHDHHPFHRRMHEGRLGPVELRRWVQNRWYYQTRIPIKDAHILARSEDPAFRRMWIHLFRLVAEVVQLPRKMTLTNCREVIVFRNRKPVLKALCSGRPVFILGGHFGNWEVSTATFGMFGFPMGIVARKLDNPLIHRWFFESRAQSGHQVLLKRGG